MKKSLSKLYIRLQRLRTNYLIVYDYENFVFVDAKNIEDCIIQFADYTDCSSDLFLKALKGCTSTKDYIDMYSRFSRNNINSIMIIQQILYDDNADKNDIVL